ncbi:hypothetical protein C9I86_05785 [Photobacterium sp. NCIMB 13483]|nr:hypothetical protein C9I86_05785 [Photobacterium sp. NCIMB 13483]
MNDHYAYHCVTAYFLEIREAVKRLYLRCWSPDKIRLELGLPIKNGVKPIFQNHQLKATLHMVFGWVIN